MEWKIVHFHVFAYLCDWGRGGTHHACMHKIVSGGPQRDHWAWSNHTFSCDFHQHIPGRSHTLSVEGRKAIPPSASAPWGCDLQPADTYLPHKHLSQHSSPPHPRRPRGRRDALILCHVEMGERWRDPGRKQLMIYYTVLQEGQQVPPCQTDYRVEVRPHGQQMVPGRLHWGGGVALRDENTTHKKPATLEGYSCTQNKQQSFIKFCFLSQRGQHR